MDFEEKRKRQLVRVVIAEIIMVLAVIVIVIISTLAAMGFMISSNGNIEQSGLMQLHTLPTGASVSIDGNTIFPRTNLSRTMTAGEHSLEIFRDGYDTWRNTIKVRSGVLIRLYYPRLFLQNRTAEAVKTLSESDALEFYVPSSSRNYILYALNDAPQWQLIDLRGDEVKVTLLDLSGVLPGMMEDPPTKTAQAGDIQKHNYTFQGKIVEVRWSNNEEAVLVKVSYEEKTEWVLVKLRDVASSLNLTRTFGLSNEADLKMIDSSSSQLYVLERGQIRRINATDGVMSRVLLDHVSSFASYGSNLIYLFSDDQGKNRYIGVYRDNEKSGTKLIDVPDEAKVKIAISNYYGDDYVSWVIDQQLTILYGRLPSYNENGADLTVLKPLVEDMQYSMVPEKFTVSPDGEYLFGQADNKAMMIDLDDGELHEYEMPNSHARWFDSSMLYTVQDHQIIVWDFDGANRRNLSESVTQPDDLKLVDNNAPVMVTANNRWIYYLVNDGINSVLVRERIRD